MKPIAVIALVATLVLGLIACGGDDDGDSAGSGGNGGQPGSATQPNRAGGSDAGASDGDGDGPRERRAAQPKRRPFVVGIGEQNSPMFADERFRDLGIKHARLVVPYDAVGRGVERNLADLWLSAARSAGVEPFITFGHSRARPEKLPTVAEFRAAFRAFRKRYPYVKVYAPWNEINHASQPTARSPRRAAQFYNVVKAGCESCTVLAGDVLDQRGMTRYVEQYRRHLDGDPEIWGLHNYADTNRFRSSGLRDLLRAVRGDVWLTETGGIVKFGRNFPRDEQRAARSIRYAFRLAREHPRVKRVYLYNWTGAKPADRFDSGLIGPNGTARPGYDALRAELRG